jgi:hypothetical protein
MGSVAKPILGPFSGFNGGGFRYRKQLGVGDLGVVRGASERDAFSPPGHDDAFQPGQLELKPQAAP